jgi:predicted RNase H-like HicB family nuclease
MAIRVSLQNSAGELDGKTVKSAMEAAKAAIEIIKATGELYDGDKIVVTGNEEE